MRILTPEYAAPEQLRGEPVTAASDVYALGAVLYELLSGCRPFDRLPRDTGDGPGHEPRDAAPPSSALSRPRVEIASVAAARGSTPDRLRRALKGDLDTVVLKALAEEPALRYPAAQQLVDDLERQRAGLPIRARPAGFGYRAGKFVRRHRAALGTAAVLALSLLGGLAAALWQAGIAAREREDALLQRAIAEDQRDAAEEVVRFLEGMFASANPFLVAAGPDGHDAHRRVPGARRRTHRRRARWIALRSARACRACSAARTADSASTTAPSRCSPRRWTRTDPRTARAVWRLPAR
jgi:eukaryotic-like serine/threonine-protein kinase